MLSELLSLISQETRLLRLTTPLGDGVLTPECVRGEESLSGGFHYRISALSADASLPLRALLGQPALLELQTTLGEARPFHGHITGVEANGANGGMARYTLTLEPWSAFLGHNRDSRIFQDQNVFDILDAVFGAWQGQGKLAPAWRFDVQDRSAYPVRSLTTQYQESDLAFAERLMHEEGLFHYYLHRSDGHELVIADDNSSFQPNAQAQVRFTQPGAVMREDSMDRWRCELKLQTNAVELSSWDYRTLDARPVSAASTSAGSDDHPMLTSRDAPGAYAYASRAHGQRIADQQLQALEAAREVYTGAGTVRTLAPGTTFTLNEHALGDGNTFLVTRVVHMMHNNLSADLHAGLMQRLGESALGAAIAAEQAGSLHAVGKQMGERPLYRNRIDAIRSDVPYRASGTDGHGQLLHPRPTIRGQQTAVVVGPAGAAVHTDRDHRVKVQFHWQRGAAGHSRLNHPAPDSHSGAPADDSVGAWVRIATPLAPQAGANWGSNAVPRIGQEVLVDFIDGNIDRPVVIGAVYNGQGQADAQHNQVAQGGGASTGNAPAWFPGEAEAHAHPAVLSGLKSQALPASQGGGGAYSQLVFDDTPGQPRIGLQRHGAAHQGTAELNLGHLRQQTDNQRLKPAGFGAELKSAHGAALRAGKGMLISADVRNGAAGHQLDAREAQAQIELAGQLQTTLATTAQTHTALLPAEPAPEKIPAIAAMTANAQVLDAKVAGTAGKIGGDGEAAAYSAAVLQLSTPAGIAAVTPASAVLSAGASSSLAAGQDINLAAQANSLHMVRDGISLFTNGKADSGEKPNQETGIRLHAASGKVSSQSQSGATTLTADRLVTVASVGKEVRVAAKQHILLTAQGAYLKLEGGNIEVHGPGTMNFKAGSKELTGPSSSSIALPALPKSQAVVDAAPKQLFSQQINAADLIAIDTRFAGMPYQIWQKGKPVQLASGQLDQEGMSTRLFTEQAEDLHIIVGDAGWEVIAPDEPEPAGPKGDGYEV
jgi:type VI secretion system VgrG family protein